MKLSPSEQRMWGLVKQVNSNLIIFDLDHGVENDALGMKTYTIIRILMMLFANTVKLDIAENLSRALASFSKR
jgi:hypothetical protein